MKFFLLILFLTPYLCFAQVTESDSLVLKQFYDATNGESWTNKTNWLSDKKVSEWYGVSVQNGRVSKIELNNNNLSGEIISNIGLLDSLDEFTLVFNNISGSIPTEIGSCKNLEIVDLSFNNLTDTIPTSIGDLNNLWYLALWDNELEGILPKEMGNMKNLKWLFLALNDFTGVIPEEFSKLDSLERLDLSENNLGGTIPAGIGDLKSLRRFEIRKNNFTGSIPASFTKLDSLQKMYIDFNQFTGLPDLSGLKILSDLQVEYNKLTFGDLEQNINSASESFSYSPQDSVGLALDTVVASGDSIKLDATISGEFNKYQWFKDGLILSSDTNAVLAIENVDSTHAGNYFCQINNSVVTGLTLNHRIMKVKVDISSKIISENHRPIHNFQILHNYPNPFNPTTNISYYLPHISNVEVIVFDCRGRLLMREIVEPTTVGLNNYKFDGSSYSSGIYFINMKFDGKMSSHKIILMR